MACSSSKGTFSSVRVGVARAISVGLRQGTEKCALQALGAGLFRVLFSFLWFYGSMRVKRFHGYGEEIYNFHKLTVDCYLFIGRALYEKRY